MTDKPHPETLHGSCLCGVNKYTVSGSPDLFLLCHCTYCKKDTGSAHGANLIFMSGSLAWHGQDSTKRQTFNLEGTSTLSTKFFRIRPQPERPIGPGNPSKPKWDAHTTS